MEKQINYFEEKENIDNYSSDFLKFKTGQYKLKCLSEIESYEWTDKNEPNAEPETRYRVLVDFAGEQKVWGFGYGRTPASTYGQLVQIACANKGSLMNVEVLVIVKSDGKKNDYTILDLKNQSSLSADTDLTTSEVSTEKIKPN